MQRRDWRYGDLIAAICEWFGCAESTARRNLLLALQYNYIERLPSGYRLTQLAETQLEMYGRLTGVEGFRFARYCSGRPGLHLRILREAKRHGRATAWVPLTRDVGE